MPVGLFYFFIIIFSLIVGSFLNCLIYRLSFEQSLCQSLKGRSFCPHCRHKLSAKDLIPLLSFLLLKGRCRYCQKKISPQYPLVELLTAIVFFGIFYFYFTSFRPADFVSVLYLLITAGLLIVIFFYDLKHYLIPDKIMYPAVILALVYNFFFHGFFQRDFNYFLLSLATAFLTALPFFIIVFASKGRWMGGADIKLAFFMGLFLNWPAILPALFLAFFIGAFFGLILIIAGKKTLKSEIPFAPFLISGTFLALFWGWPIIDWYVSLFLI